jgi:hypothetical protein
MKKAAFLVLAIVTFTFLMANFVLADSRDDLQAIKKAVKGNPNYEEGKEVKWFKLLVTDNRTNKDKVKITLPLSLVEAFIKCADNKHLKINHEECDIDLQALFTELKKVGPMAIIEVYENEETVKVWLE